MLIELDKEDYHAILEIRDDPDCIDPTDDKCKFLFDSRFIVESNHNEINKLMLSNLMTRFNSSILSLTIAPTRDCNFNCPYCYEENRINKKMSKEVQTKIIDFVKNKYSTIDSLGVVWYGGEPLLALNIVKYLSSELQKHVKKYSAFMVTNGFLLDKLIDTIVELKISGLQITLDGTNKTHNQTRHLKNGKGTFDKILSNIDALLAKHQNIDISIRMNICQANSDQYVPLLYTLKERFGRKVHLYPAFVRDYGRGCVSGACFEDSVQKARFLKSIFDEYSVYTKDIYPLRANKGCMSQKMNAFVIGTEGELYKCWHHLGVDEKIVGSIFDPNTITNYSLLSDMMIKGDGLFDNKCKSCILFPSCHGGCVDEKNRNKDYCIPAKAMLEDFIDIHYAIKTGNKLADE